MHRAPKIDAVPKKFLAMCLSEDPTSSQTNPNAMRIVNPAFISLERNVQVDTKWKHPELSRPLQKSKHHSNAKTMQAMQKQCKSSLSNSSFELSSAKPVFVCLVCKDDSPVIRDDSPTPSCRNGSAIIPAGNGETMHRKLQRKQPNGHHLQNGKQSPPSNRRRNEYLHQRRRKLPNSASLRHLQYV